jgi:hypothetical protein
LNRNIFKKISKNGYSFREFTINTVINIRLTLKSTQGEDSMYRMTQKTGTSEKPNENWRNQRKKIIDRNWTIKTCLLRDSNSDYQCLKITSCRWRPPPCMHSFTATTHFKFPVLLCHPVCVACSAECDSVAFCRACNTHKVTQKNGKFEMRSGSERMHTWRRTPSTGRNFQTLIIWITVS